MKESGHDLKIPKCCSNEDKSHHLICDSKGYITEVKLRFESGIENIDFSTFPILQNVYDIIFQGFMFKNNTFPAKLFEMPNLKSLQDLSSNITRFESINKNCGIEKLSFYDNKIKGFPDQIINCSKLNSLDLSINKEIGNIPDSISSLKNLKELFIGITGLTSMSEEVFKLNLKNFDIDGNPGLTTEIHNFGTKLDSCDFRNTNIICYEPGTCSMFVKNITMVNDEEKVEYSKEEDMPYNQCVSSKDGKSTSKIIHIMLAGFVFLILVGGLVIWYLPRKKSKEKDDSVFETKKNNFYMPPKSSRSPSFIDKSAKTRSFKVLSVTSSSATLNNNNSNSSLNNINNSFTNNSFSNSPIQSINSNNDINDNNNDNNKYIFIDYVDNNTVTTNKPNNNSNIDVSSPAFQSPNLLSPQLGSTNNNNNGIGYKNALSMYYSDLFDSSQLSQEYSFINQMKNES